MMNKKIVILGLVVVLLLFATTSTAETIDLNPDNMSSYLNNSTYTRGIRTNNPLNIKKSSRRVYYGKIPLDQNTDSINEQFLAFPFGIAAAIVHIRDRYITGTLGRIQNCVGQTLVPPYNTISKIANVWAPKGCDPGPNIPNGNQPDEYAAFVARESGFNVNMIIDGTNYEMMSGILKAMCIFENGTKYRNTVFANWDKDFKIAWVVANL